MKFEKARRSTNVAPKMVTLILVLAMGVSQYVPQIAWAARNATISVNQAAPTQDAYGQQQVEGTADYLIAQAESALEKKLNKRKGELRGTFDGSEPYVTELKKLLSDENRKKPPVEVVIDPDGKYRFLDGHHSNKTRSLLAERIYAALERAGGTLPARDTFIRDFLNDNSVKVQVTVTADYTSNLADKTVPWRKFAWELLTKGNGYLTAEGIARLRETHTDIGLWDRSWSSLSTEERTRLRDAVAEAFRRGDMPNTFVPGQGTQLQNSELRSLIGDVMRLRNINGTAFENFVQFPLARMIQDRMGTDLRLQRIMGMTNYNQKLQALMRWIYETPEGQEVIFDLQRRARPGGTETAALVQVLNSIGAHLNAEVAKLNESLPVDRRFTPEQLREHVSTWRRDSGGVAPTVLLARFAEIPNGEGTRRLDEMSRAVQQRSTAMAEYRAGRSTAPVGSQNRCQGVGVAIAGISAVGAGIALPIGIALWGDGDEKDKKERKEQREEK